MSLPPSRCVPSSDVVVIGAGISGLCAAYAMRRAAPDLKVAVLEAGGAAGGNLRRVAVGESFVDAGAQTVNGLSPELEDMLRSLGLESLMTWSSKPEVRIYARGRLRGLPRWSHDGPMARDILRLGYVSGPTAALGAIRSLRAAFSREAGGGISADTLRSAVRAGAEPSLLAPLRESSYDPGISGDPTRRRQAWGLSGGTAQLAERLERELGPVIETGSPVAKVLREGQGRLLVDARGEALRYADAVICATPAPVAGGLLADHSVSEVLTGIPYRASATVTFRLADGSEPLHDDVTGILVGDARLAPLVAVSFLDRKFDRAGTGENFVRCSLRVGPSMDTTPEAVCRLAAERLGAILGHQPRIVDRAASVFRYGVPQASTEDVRRLREAQAGLGEQGIQLAGSYLARPSGLRAAISSAFQAVDALTR